MENRFWLSSRSASYLPRWLGTRYADCRQRPFAAQTTWIDQLADQLQHHGAREANTDANVRSWHLVCIRIDGPALRNVCWKIHGRLRAFSYGYYPPNLLDDPGRPAPKGRQYVRARPKFPWVPEGMAPDNGLPSMPLIIPPAKAKTYDLFGTLFKTLWLAAEDVLTQAEHMILIGYSFPRTDHQSHALFAKAFSRRSSVPRVSIVDPSPERAANKFRLDFGIPADKLFVYPKPFTRDFDLASIL